MEMTGFRSYFGLDILSLRLPERVFLGLLLYELSLMKYLSDKTPCSRKCSSLYSIQSLQNRASSMAWGNNLGLDVRRFGSFMCLGQLNDAVFVQGVFLQRLLGQRLILKLKRVWRGHYIKRVPTPLMDHYADRFRML